MGEQDGQELPDWLTDELYDEIKRIGKFVSDNFVASKTLRKINAGLFLGNLKSKIKSLVANKSSQTLAGVVRGFKHQTKKLNIYSAVGALQLTASN